MRPQIPVTGTRIRLIALWVLLAAAAAGAAYLVATWVDRPVPLAGPVKGDLDETPLDQEVLTRPGVAEFRKLGGRIVADSTRPGKPIVEVHAPVTPLTDAGLAHLKEWTAVRVLDLSGTNISDAGLENLRGLAEVETVFLAFTKIKGDGLAHLAALPRLANLDLSKTAIADQALAHLRGLQTLQTLSLNDVPITDEGVRHLASLSRLRRLDLAGTQVTDDGLVHLQGLAELRFLSLNYAPVTAAGRMALQKKIPDLVIGTSE